MTALAAVILMASIQINPSGPTDMDFWVGDWTLGSTQFQNGKEVKGEGENLLKKTLNGRVIEENFSFSNFIGRSWTVYNPKKKLFKQTWVDNSGAYLLFEGGKVGNSVILNQIDSAGPAQRMVFSKIKEDSLTWEWMSRAEGAKDWTVNWRLEYQRSS